MVTTPEEEREEAAPNPLKSFLNVPGGISEKDAIQRATDSLEMIRHNALEEIDDALSRVAKHVDMGDDSRAAAHDLHMLGNSVSSLAGMFGLPQLGVAAYCLCELVDVLTSRGVWDREAVMIHYDAMRKLREPREISPEERERLIDGLRKVTLRLSRAPAVRAVS
ncbi:MAG: hypothetical protein WDM79_09585 [Terricaulis sp.]